MFGLSGTTVAMVGATLGAAAIGANASRGAANSAADATQAGIGEEARQYDQTRADYAPWRQAGQDALGQLQSDINKQPTAAEVMATPGYQFGLDQGQQAIDRKIAASGGRVSGASIKAAGRFGTNYATTGYGAAYQRGQDRLNRLAALAGVGQTATTGTAMAGQNSANQISGMTTDLGGVNAALALRQGNIWGNAGNSIAALYGRSNGATPSGASPGFGVPVDPSGNGWY